MIELIPIGLLLLIGAVIALLLHELTKQASGRHYPLPTQQPRSLFQRVSITHPRHSKASNPKHQRVLITHPKRNDWDNRRFDKPLPPLKKSDWRHPSCNRVPWFKRVADTISSGSSQRVNPKQQELLSLLNGDRDTAQRLLIHAKLTNPGESETWYFEKVISDIIRDRR